MGDNIEHIHFSFPTLGSRLVFWHQEVASGPFCFLVNSSWLLVFALLVFSFFISGFNLYCWKGIHFSFSLDLGMNIIFFGLIIPEPKSQGVKRRVTNQFS